MNFDHEFYRFFGCASGAASTAFFALIYAGVDDAGTFAAGVMFGFISICLLLHSIVPKKD